ALGGELPRGLESLWFQFLSDLVAQRLDDEEAPRRYAPLFADPARAAPAMRALQAAWSAPQVLLFRELVTRDLGALTRDGSGSELAPFSPPTGTGAEGTPAGEAAH